MEERHRKEISAGILGLQMYQAGDTNRNTIVVYTSPLQLGPGDCIRITGVTQPITEYQNLFGATLSAPAIDAEHINKIDCSESIEPARMIINVDQTQEKDDIKVTLHKVEFSDKNTRVYLTIENTNSSEDIAFYDFNSRAIQDKTQFITTTSFDVRYPSIESTIPQGIVENGVILFEPLDPTKPEVQFRFEANKESNNFELIFDINLALDYYKSILTAVLHDSS